MIIDTIENMGRYKGFNCHFDRAIEYLTNADLFGFPIGKQQIFGEVVYMNIADLDDSDNVDLYEVHRKYADIQMILCGENVMEATQENALDGWGAYHADTDCQFTTKDVCGVNIALSAGHFCVFFPGECHRGKGVRGFGASTKKVVVKVLWNEC